MLGRVLLTSRRRAGGARGPFAPRGRALQTSAMLLRSAMLRLSSSPFLRRFAEQSAAARPLASRFVAGSTATQALEVATRLQASGLAVSLDLLGEYVQSEQQAREYFQSYRELLSLLDQRAADATLSIKLTQMGLDLNAALARELVAELTAQAARRARFVRVDMEGSAYTTRTLELVKHVHRQPWCHQAIGVAVQSALHRSARDVDELLAEGIGVRLCKGAYREPASVTMQRKRDVDENFVRLMRRLVTSGIYHGIATHDEAIVRETVRFARERNLGPEAFEFQMLHGIRRDLQQQLARQGWRVRVYVPFGQAWYPYFMRRLAERPANVWFVMRHVLRP